MGVYLGILLLRYMTKFTYYVNIAAMHGISSQEMVTYWVKQSMQQL